MLQGSLTRGTLISTLEANDYNTLELLLTPLQFGIPNSRLRYYLLAKARPLAFANVLYPLHSVWRHIPGDEPYTDEEAVVEIRRYLDPIPTAWLDHPCRVPDRVLEKWGRLFDIIRPSSHRTCCFTRGEHWQRMLVVSGINQSCTVRLHSDGRANRVNITNEREPTCRSLINHLLKQSI